VINSRFLAMTRRMKGWEGMLKSIRTRLGSEEGQALVEYTLIVSLIAVVCIGALTIAGQDLSDLIGSIAGQV
jgi:pilus assembly protein Flp/PilA